MDGAELCARFSFKPNDLGYCGPGGAGEAFMKYLSGNGSVDAVRKAVTRFEGLYPYLEHFAKKSGKDVLDYEVVEAYWLGNSLLDAMDATDANTILRALSRRGLPERMTEQLVEGLPEKPLLHHDFHVLYVGPGNTTQTVAPTLSTKEMCRIAPARVVEVVDEQHLIVMKQPLLFKDKQYVLGDEEAFTVLYEHEWMPDIKVGDSVAVHWGFAPMILSREQDDRLKKYTGLVRELVNDYLTASA